MSCPKSDVAMQRITYIVRSSLGISAIEGNNFVRARLIMDRTNKVNITLKKIDKTVAWIVAHTTSDLVTQYAFAGIKIIPISIARNVTPGFLVGRVFGCNLFCS